MPPHVGRRALGNEPVVHDETMRAHVGWRTSALYMSADAPSVIGLWLKSSSCNVGGERLHVASTSAIAAPERS